MRRLWFILLSVFVLSIPGEPLYAAPKPAATTSAQKKKAAAQKKRETEQRKRDAARRKAAEKRRKAAEKKHREAKRKRIKEGKPLLYVYSFDKRTGDPLPEDHIKLQDINGLPTK